MRPSKTYRANKRNVARAEGMLRFWRQHGSMWSTTHKHRVRYTAPVATPTRSKHHTMPARPHVPGWLRRRPALLARLAEAAHVRAFVQAFREFIKAELNSAA